MPIVAPREILTAAHSSGYAIGAFAAGFICGIISGWDVNKAVRLGIDIIERNQLWKIITV